MTVSEVLALLDAERDERGMINWEKLGASTAGGARAALVTPSAEVAKKRAPAKAAR